MLVRYGALRLRVTLNHYASALRCGWQRALRWYVTIVRYIVVRRRAWRRCVAVCYAGVLWCASNSARVTVRAWRFTKKKELATMWNEIRDDAAWNKTCRIEGTEVVVGDALYVAVVSSFRYSAGWIRTDLQ